MLNSEVLYCLNMRYYCICLYNVVNAKEKKKNFFC